jgi:ferric-dicitrate binding protein FerR (iron transport regulator)
MNPRVEYLIRQFMDRKLSRDETIELSRLVDTEEIKIAIRDQLSKFTGIYEGQDGILKNITRRVLETDALPVTLHRVNFLKTAWFKYAAAVVLAASLGTLAYFWKAGPRTGPLLTKSNKVLQPVIKPGGDRAVLTLADGRKIILDSAMNGNVANEGAAKVVKLADGQLAYHAQEGAGREMKWNTLSTPKGGQYQLALPDGTKVWLNAASSITYPVAFNQSQRTVKITGEAYFEVAQRPKQPFMVDFSNESAVEVLGTNFNVNAYAEEPAVRTTLLEGKVRVRKGGTTMVLAPGQQAVVTGDIAINTAVNIGQVMAWKNGAFGFDSVDVNVVLRQLARWYDIELVYPNGKPNKKIWGKIGRNLTLQQVVEVLNNLGLPCTIKEHTLIIPN